MIDTNLRTAPIKLSTTAPSAAPAQAATDYSAMKFQYADHVWGTGHGGPYAIEASFGKGQQTTLHVELNGDVSAFHRYFDPEPDLGGISTEPSRFGRSTLNAQEKDALVKALQPHKAIAEVAIVLERLTAKSPDAALAAATSVMLTGGSVGQPVSNAGGVRGLGYTVE